MKAVIMAGGFGTRLRPLTMNIPKPMVPMANKPMMHHIVSLLKKHGFDDVVSLLYYQPENIRNYFGDGSAFGIKMQYMQAEADFGTAGSVRNAAEKIGAERFIIISGDVLTDFDLSAAIEFHESKKADATIVLTRAANPLQYGVVITDGDGNITRFLEKPTWGEVFSDTINTGIYILEPHVLQMIPYKEEYDFSKNLFPMMMQRSMRLLGYTAAGYWRDVGNLNEYQEASLDCVHGRVKIDIDGEQRDRMFVGEGSNVPARRGEEGGFVIIGKNTAIDASASISQSTIGNNVEIKSGALLHNCVVWDGVVIDEGVHITNSVIGARTKVHAGALIADNTFISDEVVIGARAQLEPNIKIWPKKIVAEGAILSKSLVWEDKWLRELFTDSRISGAINIEMNPEFGAKLGTAFGAFIGQGKTVIASRDPDTSSRMMKRALSCGLMSAGVNLQDLQMTPIPILRQELKKGQAAAGFHVRKSPYDRRSLDIIFLDGSGKDLPTNKTKGIERFFFGEDYPRSSFDKIGGLQYPERTAESYRERFFANIDANVIAQSKFSVVIDYSNGIASTLFPLILGRFDCHVVALNAYIDQNKLTRTEVEFLALRNQLSHITTSLSYDVGFLIDAGAEKIFVTNEHGASISDDRLLAIVTKLFFESQRKRNIPVSKIAVPISATAEVDLIANEYGATVLRTPTTHGGMMNAALENEDVTFVGGTRGGFIFPEFLFATDGMFSVAKIIEMMAITGMRLGDAERSIRTLYRKRATVTCDWAKKGQVMRYATTEAERHAHQLIDGIKIIFDESSWVLMLPDKEDASFHIFAEADSEARAIQIVEQYAALVGNWSTTT